MAKAPKFGTDADFAKHVGQPAHVAHQGKDSFFVKGGFITYSAGSGDVGKPIKLNEDGEIDVTMLPTLVDAFLDLSDTPASYSGEAGKYLRINATPDAIEFTTIPASDLPAHASYHETGGGDAIDHGSIDGLGDDDHSQYYNSVRHTKAIHDSLGLDHGDLSGRDDDDHTQYHNDTRGDARYYTETEINAALDMTNRVVKNTCLFRVYASAAQDNITHNTWTTVVFGTETYDRGSDFASNTFTAPVNGWYDLKAIVQVHDLIDVTDALIELRFYANGSTQVSHFVLNPEYSTTGRDASLPLHDQHWLNANDTVIVQVKNNYASNDGMDITSGLSATFFTGRLVAV